MMMSIKRYASSIQIGMPTRVSAPVPTRLQSVQAPTSVPACRMQTILKSQRLQRRVEGAAPTTPVAFCQMQADG